MQQINKKQIAKIFKKQRVVFAYLFGSQAKGKPGPLSDIDIAVYFEKGISGDKRFDLRLKLIGDLMDLFKTNEIDVVPLNDTPYLLENRIIKEGKLIYSQDEKKRIFYETKAFMKYFDWDYFEKKFTQRILQPQKFSRIMKLSK